MKINLLLTIILSILLTSYTSAQTKISAKSGKTKLNIKKKKTPPILSVSDIRFTDTNGNNRIDALEDCRITFTITNSGKGAAMLMTMNVTNQSPVSGLKFEAQTVLPTVSAGSGLPVSLPISGTQNLTTGTAVIKVSFDEQLGFPPDEFELKIETKEFLKPEIKVVDYNFVTDNGIIKLGLPVQIKTLIQNTGQGTADQVSVRFVYPSANVFPNTDEQFTIWTLKPNETREIVFEFIANKKYTPPTIPIQIQVAEKYGKYSHNRDISATVEAKTATTSITITSNANDLTVNIKEGSLTADVAKNIPANAPTSKHRYALVIGNEDYTRYQNGLKNEANVEFAVADARMFSQYAEITLGVPNENVVLVENAISSVMNREIERLAKIIGYENGQAEVFLYYAGHGFPDEATKESYIMPVDISGADVSKGIKLSKLYADLTQFPTKRITVFLDACFSGGGRNGGLLAARSVKIKPKAGSVTGNLVVFSASSGEQSSLPYKDKQHGMFTYFLLKTIQETKGTCTYKALYESIKSNVELNSIKINNKDQNPELNYSKDVENVWETWKLY